MTAQYGVGLARFRVLAEGLDHPEGVTVGPDGTLFAGGEAGQVYEVGWDGAVSVVAQTGGFVLGLAADADGRLYVCDQVHQAVLRVDRRGGVETYSSGTPQDPMRVPNFPAFDAAGNLYVTDSGGWEETNGLVYRIAPDGDTQVWTRAVPAFPNGCCLDADDAALIVNQSTAEGTYRVPILPDGTAGPPELVAALPGTVPDGAALTDGGDLVISCYRPDRVYLCANGVSTVLVDDPKGTLVAAPTNVVFAGPDRRELVLASLGRWHLAAGDVELRGAPLRYPHLG